MYNYFENIKADVRDWIADEYTQEIIDSMSREDFCEELERDCWIADSVTGNASGSYFCNAAKAAQAIGDNWDLCDTVVQEFEISRPFSKGPEYLDVSIRCWMLSAAIDEVVNEMMEEAQLCIS